MSSVEPFDQYSFVADEQLNELECGPDARLYNHILEACEGILDDPGAARAFAAVIKTAEGFRFRTNVSGGYPYKVFWSLGDDGPRIEAVFPYPA